MKYTLEVKLAAVRFYLDGEAGIKSVAARFFIPQAYLKRWVRLYQGRGADTLHQDNRGRYKRVKRHPKTADQTKTITPEEMQDELRYLRAENAYLKAMQEHLLEKKRLAQE